MKSLKRFLIWVYVSVAGLTRRFAGYSIALSLGWVLPRTGGFVRGGKVKLTHLRWRFGDRRWGFNILYIVSSGMPSNPNVWVRILRAAGVKIVWNQNGVAYPGWAGDTARVERINRPMRLLEDADFVIYQSEFCKKSADRWVIPAVSPYEIVPNSVDTEAYSPAAEPLTSSPLRLLVMGSHMTPEKILVPLEALRLLRDGGMDIRLSIVGPYEWPDAHRQVADAITRLELGDAVDFHGRFLQSEAPDLYRRHHIFIHLKYMDPCPTAVIEAMACGLPVIGSASGGMPELVSADAGILLKVPEDWNALHYPSSQEVADAARSIITDFPRFRGGARTNAVSRFDVIRWLNTHERIFQKLLGK